MTQTPESGVGHQYGAHSRLGQAAAWVVIVAGVVFVVAVVFFSGLMLGWASGGHYGWRHGYGGGRGGTCPMMEPGGMMGPGMIGPGGMMGPGGPVAPPQTPTPTAPRP